MNSKNPDPLETLLQEWNVKTELPPRFGEGVWRAIERRQRAVKVPWWWALRAFLENALSRPAYATAYLALFLALGATGGMYKGAADKADLEKFAQVKYLQMVDPAQAAP